MRCRAERQPRQVRDHEADETDGAALDHGARSQKAGEHHDDHSPAGQVKTRLWAVTSPVASTSSGRAISVTASVANKAAPSITG